MAMTTQETLKRIQKIDMDREFYQSSAMNTPLLSLLALNKVNATGVEVSAKIYKVNEDLATGTTGYTEGGKLEDGGNLDYDYISNFLQIFMISVEVSRTAESLSVINGRNVLADEWEKKMGILARRMETAYINGTKSETAKKRTCNGILNMGTAISHKKSELATALDEAELKLFNAGYVNDVFLIINPANKKALKAVVADGLTIVVNPGEVVPGTYLNSYYSDYGFEVKVMMTANIPADKMVLVDADKLQYHILRDASSKEFSRKVSGDNVDGYKETIITEACPLTSVYNTMAITLTAEA